MARVEDPYDAMSDRELDRHLRALADAGLPDAKQGTANVVISLRMPQALLDELRAAATRRGEGYQTLMKRWLIERLGEESGTEPPPDLDSLPDGMVSFIDLSADQVRTLATRGELLLRLRSPAGARPRRRTAAKSTPVQQRR